MRHPHPGVRTPEQLTRGERAADRMKRVLATWPALIAMCGFIVVWALYQRNSGFDPYPWILLNLCLSAFAGLQCFVLLIANKRGEQIAAEIAVHTLKNTDNLQTLIDRNTVLTQETHDLTALVRELVDKPKPAARVRPVKAAARAKPKGT